MVTTTVLGDVVEDLVGDSADVVTLMPPGVSPHDFQASARQVRTMREADLLIVNGAGFEEGLLDVINAAQADGVSVFEAISAVDTLPFGHHGDDGHGPDDDDHGDHSHHGDIDPHFFTDPTRMADFARAVLEEVTKMLPDEARPALEARGGDFIDELVELDRRVEEELSLIASEDRILFVNHDVFGYFAQRYGFTIAGTVIPTGSTTGGTSARSIEDMARAVRASGVPAIFADASAPTDVARTVAGEAGGVEVVELFTESLGGPGSDGETYQDMVWSNAQRITAALTAKRS